MRLDGFHIQKIESDMVMETMCPCTYLNYALHHWKCALRCCDKCPSIVIPSKEENRDTPNTCTTIRFHVYISISCCKLYDRLPC